MIRVPMKSSGAVNKQTVMTLNNIKIQSPRSSRDIKSINSARTAATPGAGSNNIRTAAVNSLPAAPAVNNNGIIITLFLINVIDF